MMGNSIFDMMNSNQSMISQFLEFKKNFRGNPQEEVQRLLNSGKMSQEQYNQLANMANNLKRILK